MQALEASETQLRAHRKPSDLPATDQNLDSSCAGSGEIGIDTEIIDVAAEMSLDTDALSDALWPKALLTLVAILFPQRPDQNPWQQPPSLFQSR